MLPHLLRCPPLDPLLVSLALKSPELDTDPKCPSVGPSRGAGFASSALSAALPCPWPHTGSPERDASPAAMPSLRRRWLIHRSARGCRPWLPGGPARSADPGPRRRTRPPGPMDGDKVSGSGRESAAGPGDSAAASAAAPENPRGSAGAGRGALFGRHGGESPPQEA